MCPSEAKVWSAVDTSIIYYLLPLSFPSSLPLSFLPSVDSIRDFAHAADFASARRCLRFLVVIDFTLIFVNISLSVCSCFRAR